MIKKIKRKRSKKLSPPKRNHELNLRNRGYQNIAGADEVGRGALAGPLVAACVILPENNRVYGVRDSKLLCEKEREYLSKRIKKAAFCFNFGIVEKEEIENFGLGQAGFLAFSRAILGLRIKPDFVLVDGFALPNFEIPHRRIIRGDMLCYSIAAASILAKVFRDELMRSLSSQYPDYLFEKNKGYGTKAHLRAIEKKGPCEMHRRNFHPVKSTLRNFTR